MHLKQALSNKRERSSHRLRPRKRNGLALRYRTRKKAQFSIRMLILATALIAIVAAYFTAALYRSPIENFSQFHRVEMPNGKNFFLFLCPRKQGFGKSKPERIQHLAVYGPPNFRCVSGQRQKLIHDRFNALSGIFLIPQIATEGLKFYAINSKDKRYTVIVEKSFPDVAIVVCDNEKSTSWHRYGPGFCDEEVCQCGLLGKEHRECERILKLLSEEKNRNFEMLSCFCKNWHFQNSNHHSN